MKVVFAVVFGALFIALVVASFLWQGLVMVKLWEWFIVPFGLPELHMAHAIGLSIFFGFAAHQVDWRVLHQKAIRQHFLGPVSHEDEIVDSLVILFVRPLLYWYIGWMIHLFMPGA